MDWEGKGGVCCGIIYNIYTILHGGRFEHRRFVPLSLVIIIFMCVYVCVCVYVGACDFSSALRGKLRLFLSEEYFTLYIVIFVSLYPDSYPSHNSLLPLCLSFFLCPFLSPYFCPANTSVHILAFLLFYAEILIRR